MKNESIVKFKEDLFKAFVNNASIDNGTDTPNLQEDANKELKIGIWIENPFEMEVLVKYIPVCTYVSGNEITEDQWEHGGFEFNRLEVTGIEFVIFGTGIDFIHKRSARDIVIKFLNEHINV